MQSEVAYPIALTLRNDSSQDVTWEGPLTLLLAPKDPATPPPPQPLTLWVKLQVAHGQSQKLDHRLLRHFRGVLRLPGSLSRDPR